MHSLAVPPLIHSAGVALGLLLALLLLGNRTGNRAANRWLAAYISCLTLLWFEDLLEETGAIFEWPWLAHRTDWLIFLVGPCLWMYVRRLTRHDTPSFVRWLPHSALAALCLWLLISNFYVLPLEARIAVMRADAVELSNSLNVPLLIAAAQIMAYWVASIVVLKRFNASLREHYSSLGERSFGWLRTMLAITLAMWILWVVGLLFLAPWAKLLSAVAVPPGLYLLAFFGFRQPAVFAEGEEPGMANANGATRYARSGLDRERVPEFLARLEGVMRAEKPWLEPDLTLADLATRAGLSAHYLSQLLNEELGQSFFDYINSHRVAEVKRCLLDAAYGSQTILDIAVASGFRSKTAFNAAFRQNTGMTPSEFRRGAGVRTGPQSA